MSALPRMPLWGGRVEGHAIWVDRAMLGEQQARARVFALLREDTRVLDVEGGYLVMWSRAHSVDVEQALGLVLVRDGEGVYRSGPLRDIEREEISAVAGQWIHVRNGKVQTVDVHACPTIDLATWIDVSLWHVSPADTLGGVPPVHAPAVVQLDEDRGQTVREMLGDAVPEPAPERDELLEALRTLGPGGTSSRTATTSTPSTPRWMQVLGRWLGDGGSTAGYPMLSGGSGQAGGAAHGLSPAPEPAKPGFFARLWRRFVVRSPLSELIGRRQAEYLERMMGMFENGDIDEALRHAIPFSSMGGGASSPPSINMPSPRDSLDLSAHPRASAGGVLNLDTSAYDRLKDLYRAAAERLEREGRIEETAYVFFELLGERDNGLALLERHGRYGLAATMAQGHDVEPGAVIRLWFLAGEPHKGVLVAIRTGTFADAVARLEPNHREHADRLRLIWAGRLAAAGDYAAAVKAIWPTEQARHVAKDWVDRAIAMGGGGGAQMLARKASLWPDDAAALAEVSAALDELVAREDDAAAHERLAFANTWADLLAHQPAAIDLSGVARRLMLDAANVPAQAVLQRLSSKALDPVFALDLGWASTVEHDKPPERGDVHGVVFDPNERGLGSLVDAIVLPQGGFAVALGEAGLAILDARGRVTRRYREPASALVLADSGLRMLTLHPRGDAFAISRVDLESGRHRPWTDVKLQAWTHTYDGCLWYVATRDAVLAIDVQAERFDAVWRVGNMRGHVAHLARNHHNMWFASFEAESSWIWEYELQDRGPALRRKREGPTDVDTIKMGHGGVAVGWREDEARCELALDSGARKAISTPQWIHVSGDIAYAVRDDAGMSVFLVGPRFESGRTITLLGSSRTHAHSNIDGALVLVDDLGRVITLDRDRRIVDFVTVDA